MKVCGKERERQEYWNIVERERRISIYTLTLTQLSSLNSPMSYTTMALSMSGQPQMMDFDTRAPGGETRCLVVEGLSQIELSDQHQVGFNS